MAQPLTPELLVYGITAPGDPQISPDSTAIVYSLATGDAPGHRMLSQVWMCNRDGSDARQITQAGDHNGGARWSPDGEHIAFVSDRVKKAGIFVLSLARGGDARELTRHNQGISDLTWSPDGSQIAYTTVFDPENPTEAEDDPSAPPKARVTRRIDYKQDGRGYLGDKRLHTWVVSVASGERQRLTTEALDHAFPQWSPSGSHLAVLVSDSNGMHSRIAVIEVESGSQEYVTPQDGVVGTFAWSPSGDRIIYAGDTDRTWQHDIFVYDVSSGETRRLTDDLACLPVGGAPGEAPPSQPVWLDDRQVLFHAMCAGGSGLYVIDSEGGGVEQVASWQAQHGGFSTDRNHHYVVQSRTSLDDVAEITVHDMRTGDSQTITSHGQALLQEYPAAQWERFDVHRGKYTIEAWLLKPADFDPAKKYPVVLDIHGGPNGFYGYAFSPLHEMLATNGYLVVYSNPRGSSSYGREFTQQVTEDWGGEDYLDLMAVTDEVLKRPYADAERTGVSGYSYGGYMTAWIIGQTSRFKAAVCGAPCFDLESMYGTSDISHVFGELQWGGQPHTASEWYAAHSPSTYAHRATTPTLIIHGEADERCPIGQGEQMFVALTKAGCEVEFARYPGASHGFRRSAHPALRVDCWQRTLDWFDAHLK